MDNFAEQLVKRQMSGGARTKKFFTLFGGMMLTFFLSAFSFLLLSMGTGLFPFVGFLLAAGAGYGTPSSGSGLKGSLYNK